MTINKELIQLIELKNLKLDEIVYLYDCFTGHQLDFNPSAATLKKLEYYGYILHDKVTSKGEELIGELLRAMGSTTPTITNSAEDKFNEIWLAFPKDDSTDVFPKTRLIRYNKDKTKRDYLTALREYSHEELLKAVKAEVSSRSVMSKDNMLKYMKSSHNWFEQKVYLDWMDTTEKEIKDEYGKQIS